MKTADAWTLAKVIWPDFVHIDGLYFTAASAPRGRIDYSLFPDLTSIEAVQNHVHVVDLFERQERLDKSDMEPDHPDHPDFEMACEIGSRIARAWHAKLATEFPDLRFRVYFTTDGGPVVRFHLVRPNERSWLDERDWSTDIKKGRLVVLDTQT